jgi:hypothetical protein
VGQRASGVCLQTPIRRVSVQLLNVIVNNSSRTAVLLGTTEDGAGLVLGGEKGGTQLLSRGADPFIKIVAKDGRERTIKP